MSDTKRREVTREVIREISQVIHFARSSWHDYAELLHPDITRACIPTLLAIAHRDEITQADLITVQNAEKSAISKQVSLLKSIGLVESRASKEDRRVTLLSVTPDGKTRVAAVRELLVNRYEDKLNPLDINEMEQLRDLLHRFNESNPAQAAK